MTAHDNGRTSNGAAGLNVAIVQMNSQDDKRANIAAALDLIDRAAATSARLVALPEVWPYLGPDDVIREQAETIPGPITDHLAQRARRHGIYIHGGSIYETRPGDPGMYNTTVVLDPTGEIIARYSKIHMYDVVLDGVAEYQESATVTRGDEIAITEIDGIPVGLTICYDLRFPELFRILALKGAQAIILPAAFTLMTGKDHWESMVVDPWGTVVTTASDGVGITHAIVDPARVDAVRRQIPSLANRRPEAYAWPDESASLAAGHLVF
jgi:predicted amidohydrolase